MVVGSCWILDSDSRIGEVGETERAFEGQIENICNEYIVTGWGVGWTALKTSQRRSLPARERRDLPLARAGGYLEFSRVGDGGRFLLDVGFGLEDQGGGRDREGFRRAD